MSTRTRKHRLPVFAAAAERWSEIRADFELHRESAYEHAERACHGVLLNARGKRLGIDPYSLFIGSDIRARAYASPELIEHWAKHPRVTFARFEEQHTDRRGGEA